VKLWSGRVGGELAPEVWEFLHADDAELLPYDLQGTLLHAQRLHGGGILDDAELHALYVEDIPVLLINGKVHNYWRIDPLRLRTALLAVR